MRLHRPKRARRRRRSNKQLKQLQPQVRKSSSQLLRPKLTGADATALVDNNAGTNVTASLTAANATNVAAGNATNTNTGNGNGKGKGKGKKAKGKNNAGAAAAASNQLVQDAEAALQATNQQQQGGAAGVVDSLLGNLLGGNAGLDLSNLGIGRKNKRSAAFRA